MTGACEPSKPVLVVAGSLKRGDSVAKQRTKC